MHDLEVFARHELELKSLRDAGMNSPAVMC
jgi:hypothetical protein